MPALLPPLRLTGALVLRDGAVQRRSVAFAAGRLTRGPLPEVDLSGFMILPGIVDIHAPLAAQHGTGQIDPGRIRAAHAHAAATGVTTMVSVLNWGWTRGPNSAELVSRELASLSALRPRLATDSQVHLLAEMSAVRDEAHLLSRARDGLVQGVIFVDTATGPFDPLVPAVDPLREALRIAQRDRRDIPRHLCRLAEGFDALSIVYGSHSDPDGETRERHSMIGARIAVFPATRRAAAAAHAMMSPVVLPAPALISGDRLIAGLVAEGLCDALASNGRPQDLVTAVHGLAATMGWPEAWSLISSRPAEMLRLPDRGQLTPGMRADLVVIRPESGEVQATICGGRLTYLGAEAADRFRAQPFAAPLLPGADLSSMAAE